MCAKKNASKLKTVYNVSYSGEASVEDRFFMYSTHNKVELIKSQFIHLHTVSVPFSTNDPGIILIQHPPPLSLSQDVMK